MEPKRLLQKWVPGQNNTENPAKKAGFFICYKKTFQNISTPNKV